MLILLAVGVSAVFGAIAVFAVRDGDLAAWVALFPPVRHRGRVAVTAAVGLLVDPVRHHGHRVPARVRLDADQPLRHREVPHSSYPDVASHLLGDLLGGEIVSGMVAYPVLLVAVAQLGAALGGSLSRRSTATPRAAGG